MKKPYTPTTVPDPIPRLEMVGAIDCTPWGDHFTEPPSVTIGGKDVLDAIMEIVPWANGETAQLLGMERGEYGITARLTLTFDVDESQFYRPKEA